MSDYIFVDKNIKPDDKLLSEKIGKNFPYWTEIKEHVNEKYGSTTDDWKFYGKNYGWQLKTLIKKRNLFFLIPFKSYFKIVFIFGDRAVNEIEQSDVTENLKNDVINAKKYAEGRGLAIEVIDNTYMTDIKKLIEIKINN